MEQRDKCVGISIFFVDHEGVPFMRIGSMTAPSDEEVVGAIEQLLNKAKEAK